MKRAALFLASLGLFCVVFAVNDPDEFYCQKKEGEYQICRKCISLDDTCEDRSSECKCDNIAIPTRKGEKECKLYFSALIH